ncbi:survival factor 1 [Neohortaea acidophila]|uniref:Ceramide-binding protein SVF1 n=1 Tax=Neohortaea acidophila TaxID=245834 RepID=A0A6A6Q855_9PEZI|nr:survival factor 1 [Neohortaea acidophila]KAF2488229.1 survival factor 1 [Neohortaea acidophila]
MCAPNTPTAILPANQVCFNRLGVTEPVYGPSAIQSVASQTSTAPYTELQKDDLAWECMDTTNVETKTFYMLSDEGRIGLAQVIYSNVMGVRTTAQFSSKIFSPNSTQHLWSSDNLHHFTFSPDKQSFHADNCAMELSEDGKSYTIKSSISKSSIVDLKFTQEAPGLVVGKDGTSSFGTDPKKPWGRMIHKFWPRCRVEGQILTKEGPVDFKGTGIFVHALQGMKPHFAAAKWNFANFHSPNYSAVMMEFTTPPSYGETVVTVGSVVKKDKVLFTGASPNTKAEHTDVKGDPENDWPEPGAVRFTWQGKTADDKQGKAVLEGSLGTRTDRVDVMGELPKFVKAIVAGAAGTKPYIYQYVPKMTLKLDIGGEVVEEEGQLFMEATFIS